MRSVTDTEASVAYRAALDAVKQGETVLVTEGGTPIARIVPENTRVADRIADVLERHPLDAEAAADLARAVAELRSERTVDRIAEITEPHPADPEFGDHLARVVRELRGRPIG